MTDGDKTGILNLSDGVLLIDGPRGKAKGGADGTFDPD